MTKSALNLLIFIFFIQSTSWAGLLKETDAADERSILYYLESGKVIHFEDDNYADEALANAMMMDFNDEVEFQNQISSQFHQTPNVNREAQDLFTSALSSFVNNSGTKPSYDQQREQRRQRNRINAIDDINIEVQRSVENIRHFEDRILNSISARNEYVSSVIAESQRIKNSNYSNYKKRALLNISRIKIDSERFEGKLKDKFEVVRSKYKKVKEEDFVDEKSFPFADMGASSYQLAKKQNSDGNMGEAQRFLTLSNTFLDIAVGATPFVSLYKDAYEAYTGENLLSGEKLSTTDRAFSVVGVGLGVITGGVLGGVAKGALKTMLPFADEALEIAGGVFDSARKLKLTEKYQFRDLVDYLGDNFKRFVGNERGSISLIGKYKPAPKMPKAFQNLKITRRKTSSSGGGLRKRWKDNNGNIFEWDSQHGRIEKYNKRGKHLGEFDADTGVMTKPSDPKRKVEP